MGKLGSLAPGERQLVARRSVGADSGAAHTRRHRQQHHRPREAVPDGSYGGSPPDPSFKITDLQGERRQFVRSGQRKPWEGRSCQNGASYGRGSSRLWGGAQW